MSFNLKDTNINGMSYRIGDTVSHKDAFGYFCIEDIDTKREIVTLLSVGESDATNRKYLPFVGLNQRYYAPFVYKPISEVGNKEMKVYFYGRTETATMKKAKTFADQLKKKGENLKVTSIKIDEINENPVVLAYTYRACCQYSFYAG